jgi:hypothetical protein
MKGSLKARQARFQIPDLVPTKYQEYNFPEIWHKIVFEVSIQEHV